MARYATAALLALSSFATAVPLEDRSLSRAVCLAVDAVVDILHAYPSATPFCSSLLAIPTITTTNTVSTTAQFTSAFTTTIPTTVSTFTSTADPVTVYSTVMTNATTCVLSAINKRNIRQTTSLSSIVTRSLSSDVTTSVGASGICNGVGRPKVLSGLACSAISTACGCLSIPTPTSTVVVTQMLSTTAYPTSTVLSSVIATVVTTGTTTVQTVSTSTVGYCPTPSSCSNEGIKWAYYPNNLENSDRTYSTYDPTVIKTEAPSYNSTASVAGGLYEEDVGSISIYGSSQTFQSDYFTLNHVGYIFAPVSGTYTFEVTDADDIALLWLGATAYSGWTRANANAVAIVGYSESATSTINLEAKEYLAFRIVFGQAQGAVRFGFSITAPDGTILLDSSTNNSPYLVQDSCDGTSAPAFPPFGSET